MSLFFKSYLIIQNTKDSQNTRNKQTIILENGNALIIFKKGLSLRKIVEELRVVKRNYREGILDELPTLDFIEKVIPIAIAIVKIKTVKIIDFLTFQNIVTQDIIRKKFNPYQRLRLVEGYYCSQEINISELKKIISNPQFYASKMKDNDFTMSLISEIKKRHLIAGIQKSEFSALNIL